MRVVFDGEILGDRPLGGVAISFLHSLRAYAAIEATEPVLLLPETAVDPEIDGLEVQRRPLGALRRHLQRRSLLRGLRAALHHSPVAALPWRAPCAQIATVHDLPWMVPDLEGEEGCRLRHRLALRFAARCAAAIILPSEHSRRDLRDYLQGRCKAKLFVVPHGVPEPAESPTEQSPGEHLLCFGDQRPRKNLVKIVAAHRRAREYLPELPPLRIIGPGIDYVSEAEKQQLLHTSRAVLLLSLTEGFGLPVVEAFHYGVPVLCSDRGSLPEICGDAALQVDPSNEEAMAQAMIRIHQDQQLRDQLRDRGPARAARYSPEFSAQAWYAIHQEICA